MKISGRPGRKQRTVYGWMANGVWCLSPEPAGAARRPLNRYDAKEDAEAEAMARNCTIIWEDVLDG